jgi:hypothetical protein
VVDVRVSATPNAHFGADIDAEAARRIILAALGRAAG